MTGNRRSTGMKADHLEAETLAARDMWRWASLEQLEQDVRHGLRAMVRSPMYSVAVVVTLAMGIGAGTTAYTLARAIHMPFPRLPQEKLLRSEEHTSELQSPCNIV